MITLQKDAGNKLRGNAKALRGNLSGNALDRTEGKFEKFAGVLQEKYGYTREKGNKKIERRLKARSETQQARYLRGLKMRQSIGW